MKSNLNLLDIFDDIANEIRDKNGTTEPIAPQDMRDQIHAINSWTDESTAELERIGYSADDRINIMDSQIQSINKEVLANKEVADQIIASWDPNVTQGPTDSYDGISGSWWHYWNNNGINGYLIKYFPYIDTSNLLKTCYFLADLVRLQAIPLLDTSKVIDMTKMFCKCESLETIPQLDTRNVTDMSSMFSSCTSLTTIPQLDTSKVTNMSDMFWGCDSLKTIPLLNTSKVVDMSNMFRYCSSLTTVPQLDTDLLKDCYSMFNGCTSLVTIYGLNMINVEGTDDMFTNCTSLKEIHLKNINTYLAFSWPGYQSTWNPSDSYPEGCCPLEHNTLVELIDNLVPQPIPDPGHGIHEKVLTLGPTLKAKLSAAEIKVATDKNWTIA